MEHTPGPWDFGANAVGQWVIHSGLSVVTYTEDKANAFMIADAPDRHDQLTALLLLDWNVERRSIYDEEGIEAWVWTEPNGTEHFDIAAGWQELPDWPESAREALIEYHRRNQ